MPFETQKNLRPQLVCVKCLLARTSISFFFKILSLFLLGFSPIKLFCGSPNKLLPFWSLLHSYANALLNAFLDAVCMASNSGI